MTAVDASTLASSLETRAGKDHLPTALDFFQAGVLLHQSWSRCHDAAATSASLSSAEAREANDQHRSLSEAFRQLISTLPEAYACDVILGEINEAFGKVVDDSSIIGDDEDSQVQALQAIFGIYTNSQMACRLGLEEGLCSALATLYDRISDQQHTVDLLFRTLSALLTGLISPSDTSLTKTTEEDDGDALIRRAMEAVQALTADSSKFCLGDFQVWQKRQSEQTPLVQAVKKNLPDNPQKDYLVLMLESSTTTESLAADRQKELTSGEDFSGHKADHSSKKAGPSSVNAMDRLIAQVRDVLPTLGEGYVETALAVYSFDASRTVSALLEAEADPSALHPRLRAVDKSLPARKKESKSKYDAADDAEARELQKSRLREMEKQAEKEAYNVALVERDDMYNDDYDDQYDGIGDNGGAAGEVGGADGGLYDVDLDAMRDYNRIRREEEKESAFWEESRNLNRSKNRKGANKKDGGTETAEGEDGNPPERKYRGPDKGKGGRVIGPDGRYVPFKKGGKKGKKQANAVAAAANTDSGNNESKSNPKQNSGKGKQGGGAKGSGMGGPAGSAKASDGDNLTKIQKRRKNDNKAKIGNHHRKERALKKHAV